MKHYLNLLIAVLFAVLLISTAYSFHALKKEKAENDRLSNNLENYGRQVSELTLTKGEIKTELDKQNKTLLETQKILDEKNLEISQLEDLIATHVTIRDTDIVYVPVKPAIIIPDTNLFKSEFSTTKQCITVKGFILSTDSLPSLAITERSADIKVYDITVKRKWWQLCKPKYEHFVESNCGTVEILKINRKR